MITPDGKDWTWVLERPCEECGYDAATVPVEEIGARTRAAAVRWQAVLERPGIHDRPRPQVWSPLEYACHVRDVFAVFDGRLELMLSAEDARFANWDQDDTAVQGRYAEQDPRVVSVALGEGAETIAAHFDAVEGAAWDRTALRSDGATFTTASLGRYFLHDIEHHLQDVHTG
jgi:hypothetical protein